MPFTLSVPSMTIATSYDSIIRILQYVRAAEEQARRLLADFDNDPDDHLALRERAVNLRNQTLDRFRGRITPFGRAFSEAIKEEGKSLAELVEHYYRNGKNGLLTRENIDYSLARIDARNRALSGPEKLQRAVHSIVRAQRALRNNPNLVEQGRTVFDLAKTDLVLWQKLRDFVHQAPETVSRQIIKSSGNTNRTVNLIAKTGIATGLVVTITCGVISVMYFGYDSVPEELAGWFTYPNAETAIRGATSIVGGLVTGALARGVGSAVHHLPKPVRISAVAFTHIFFLSLLVYLFSVYISPIFK